MARLFVLDAMGLAYRAYYAFIGRPLVNSRGENISAIFGLANTVLKLRREEKPDYWALAWDGPGPTFRHERFPEYKATRKPMPEELVTQIEPIETLAQTLGLPVIELPGTEADDVMATLADRAARAGIEVVLVTADKDMLQVVGPGVRVLSPRAREDFEWVDADGVRARWGVGPEHIRDVLALMGDTSDNIPGVPGVGEKTAVELMKQFGSLEGIYARLDEVRKPALRARLEANRELAYLSRELATVRHDLALPYGWDDLRCAPIRRDALREFARRFEIRRLESLAETEGTADEEAGALAPARPAERRGGAAEMPAPGVTLAPAPARPKLLEPPPVAAGAAGAAPAAGGPGAQTTLDLWAGAHSGEGATLEGWIARLHEVRARAIHGLALLPLASGDDARRATLVGLALAARDGTACYLPLAHQDGLNLTRHQLHEWLHPVLADRTVPKVAEDLKALAHLLKQVGLPLEGLDVDLHIGSFLLDPERDHSLRALAGDALGVALPPLGPAPARGKARPGAAALPAGAAAAAALPSVAALFPIAAALRAQLEAREQWALYERLEQPLIPVLLEMERAGVAIDTQTLAEQSERAQAEMSRLEVELFELAGERVNLNSGPQIARVLFEKLKLKSGRRTKTGYSTDSAVLEELAASHPFPARLLEYRALAKLRSTYLEALPQQVDPEDGRIHTTFDQAGAATGRLSSSNPNLQNIPARTEQGRAIRRAFVAPNGMLLVGADYSQIELRVMAHLSGDPALIEAFRAGEDVHAATARRIFGLPEGPVEPRLRARAKIVNFGIMYGMGARSLSQQMGLALPEAEEFIRQYFQVYARVREYLDATLQEARRRGWVQTLLARRRYLPALASTHGGERSNAERAAINTPIQGSAADLMKLAMIRVQGALKRHRPSARLLLQVHDELLLECPTGEADAVSELVRQEMEGCFPLRVPLQAGTGRGPTWFDVH